MLGSTNQEKCVAIPTDAEVLQTEASLKVPALLSSTYRLYFLTEL